MTIVRCPRCRDEVTVPAKATARALVRCPLCLEEYLLAEALANAPPPLVIIGGEVEQAALESTPAADSEYRLAGGNVSAAIDSTGPGTRATVTPRPVLLRTAPRPRRKEKSIAFLLVNYVIGGVMGLSLGLLVLWWGFGKDPLELGPKIAQYAPRIVPPQFRGNAAPVDFEIPSAVASGGVGKMQSGNKKATAAEHSENATQLQTLPGLDESATPPDATLTPSIEAPNLKSGSGGGRKRNNRERTTPASANGGRGGLATESTDAKPPMPDLTALLDYDSAPPASPSSARPLPSAEEFAAAVDAAAAALRKYEQLPKEDVEAVRQSFVELHSAVSEVGRMISYLSAADGDLSESVGKMQTVLDSLSGATGTTRVNAIKFLTLQKWPEIKDDQGLLAAGTVKDCKATGSLFEIRLDASTRDKRFTIPLVMSNNPQDLCKTGDELVVIGRMIDEPKNVLLGYEAEQPRVLLVGFAVRVPKTR